MVQSLLENQAYSLNIRGVASDTGSVAATDGQTITVLLKQWPLCDRDQVVLVRNRPTQIVLKMTVSLLCKARELWVKCSRVAMLKTCLLNKNSYSAEHWKLCRYY